jgi:hypothetical protein
MTAPCKLALIYVKGPRTGSLGTDIRWTKVPYTDRVDGVMCCVKQPELHHQSRKEELYMGILDELLGGGQRQKEYRDFVDRYEQGNPSEGYSDQEVLKRYADVSHAVPPNQYAQAAIEALGKLSPEERAAFVKMLQERAAARGVTLPPQVAPEPKELGQVLTDLHGKPGQLRDILGGGDAQPQERAQRSNPIIDMLGSPQAKAVLAGIAAMVVKRVMQGSSRTA